MFAFAANEPIVNKFLGMTPSPVPLEIPATDDWWVVPEKLTAEESAEMKSQAVPGLRVRLTTSNADLAYLEGLSELQRLYLWRTKVTDAGLVHLKDLKGLQALSLFQTSVTDAGLKNLAGLTELQWLDLGDTQVTDAGLVQLKGLTKLRKLSLMRTRVTTAGVAELGKALPGCKILRSSPTTQQTRSNLTLDDFRALRADMTLQQVHERVGMPRRDVGSGIYILVYELTNGEQILVGSSGDRVLYDRYRERNLPLAGSGVGAPDGH